MCAACRNRDRKKNRVNLCRKKAKSNTKKTNKPMSKPLESKKMIDRKCRKSSDAALISVIACIN